MSLDVTAARPYFRWTVSATWHPRGDFHRLPVRRIDWSRVDFAAHDQSDADLARDLGVSAVTVATHRAKAGVPTSSERARLAADVDRVRRALRPEGHWLSHLSHDAGITRRRVRRALRELVKTGEASVFVRTSTGQMVGSARVYGDSRVVCAFRLEAEGRRSA